MWLKYHKHLPFARVSFVNENKHGLDWRVYREGLFFKECTNIASVVMTWLQKFIYRWVQRIHSKHCFWNGNSSVCPLSHTYYWLCFNSQVLRWILVYSFSVEPRIHLKDISGKNVEQCICGRGYFKLQMYCCDMTLPMHSQKQRPIRTWW